MIKKLSSNQHGVILPTLIILMVAFTTIGLALTSYTTGQYSRTKANVFNANATQVAEAGIEQSLAQINDNSAFAGYGSEQQFFSNTSQGRGVFTTAIAATADSNARTITATGKIYSPTSPAKVVSTKKIKVTIVGTSSQGYSVHTGPGGLILEGGANITNTDVYVNGALKLTGGAKIGTSSQPLNVNVANHACPSTANPGPTYPQLCATEPITFENGNMIYGTVCATNQVRKGNPNSGITNIVGGSTGQGLKLGCVAPKVDTPTYDRAAHIAAVTTTGAGNGNDYGYCNWPYKNHVWPNKLKLTGNVKIDSDCQVTIRGDVYIAGDFDLAGGAKIYIDNSVGTKRPVIMVDGNIRINSPGGGGSIIANNVGTGAHFVSFKSNAACNPNCTAANMTGTTLRAAQSFETVAIAGGTSFPGMSFQSYWGKIRVAAGGNVGAAIGQTVDMSGAGTVTFGTVLSSGDRSWTTTSYQQVFN